jgi:hypothetical protein
MPEEYDSFDSKQKRKFWENHIEQWEASGQSQRAYCRKHGLIVQRFYDWKRRITAADKSHVSFLPVALSDSPAPPHLSVRIHTPNGYTIEVEDQNGSIEINQLVSMVAAL